jgi:hypothetical protein
MSNESARRESHETIMLAKFPNPTGTSVKGVNGISISKSVLVEESL